MLQDFNIEVGTTGAHIAIFVSIIIFVAYYLFNRFKGILIGNTDGIKSFLVQKFSGVLLLGVIPFYYLYDRDDSLPFYMFVAPDNLQSVFNYCLLVGIVFIGISSVVSVKEENCIVYPQIRDKEWTLATAAASFVGWVSYLFAYEFLFRGYLLMSCVKELDLMGSIFINAGLYALAHFDKGRKEIVGSFVVGIVLCIITIKTGSIWVSIFSHITIALSNEYFSFKANPETSFSFFKSKG